MGVYVINMSIAYPRYVFYCASTEIMSIMKSRVVGIPYYHTSMYLALSSLFQFHSLCLLPFFLDS